MLTTLSLTQNQVSKWFESTEKHLDSKMKQEKHTLSLFNEQREQLKGKLKALNDKYVSDKIDHTSYLELKLQYTSDLNNCERQIQELCQDEHEIWNMFHENINLLTDLNYVWEEATDISNKQMLIRAMFPGSLSYKKDKTARGCNDSQKPFTTPFLIEPFRSNCNDIRHLTIKNGSKVVPISTYTPVGVANGI